MQRKLASCALDGELVEMAQLSLLIVSCDEHVVES
jgi:hypothetical protein